MTSAKRQAYLETAADLIQKVHTDLLHNKQFSRAEQLQEIMRRLVVFSSRKERPKGITFNELSQIIKDEEAIPPIIQIEEPQAEKAKLKPCPFCGGFAWVYEHTRIKNRPTYYTTHCNDCGVSDLKHHKSASEAIEAWNRRSEYG